MRGGKAAINKKHAEVCYIKKCVRENSEIAGENGCRGSSQWVVSSFFCVLNAAYGSAAGFTVMENFITGKLILA